MIRQLLKRNKQLNDIYEYSCMSSTDPLKFNMERFEFILIKLKILYMFLNFKENIEFIFNEPANILEAYVTDINTSFSINLFNVCDAIEMKKELEEYKQIKYASE